MEIRANYVGSGQIQSFIQPVFPPGIGINNMCMQLILKSALDK